MTEKIQIAIIKQNDYKFDNVSLNTITGIGLESELQNNIVFKTIASNTDDKILENIVDIIGCSDDSIHRCHRCYDGRDNSIYIIYVTSDNNTNTLGRYLSERHEPVFGNCVLLKVSKVKNVDIYIDDIVCLFRNKFVHHAIYLTTDNNMSTHTYVSNPLENTTFSESTCRCCHVEFLNKIICIFIEYEPKNNCINKYATLLCKKLKIHGDVIISMINDYPTFELCDIDGDILRSILCIKTMMSRDKMENMHDEVIHDNFYDILDKYCRQYNNEINETIPNDVLYGQTLNSTLT